MLKNPRLYKKHFSYVFIFSPYPIDDLACKEGVNYFNKFDIKLMYALIDKYKSAKRVLFIIDDFINELKKN